MGIYQVAVSINGGGGGYSLLGKDYQPKPPTPEHTSQASRSDPKPPAPKPTATSGTKTAKQASSNSSVSATQNSSVSTGSFNPGKILDFLSKAYKFVSDPFVKLANTAIETSRGAEKRRKEMKSNLYIHAQNVVAIGTSDDPVIIPIEGITDKPTYLRTAVTEYGYMLEFYPLERGMQWDELSEELKDDLLSERIWLLEKDVLMVPVK